LSQKRWTTVSTILNRDIFATSIPTHSDFDCKAVSNLRYGKKQNDYNTIQYRTFAKRGRKGAAMGHHLEKLDELAHRVNKAENKKKKGNQKKSDDSVTEDSFDDHSEDFDDDDDDNEGDEENIPSLPSIEKTQTRMESILSSLENSFRSIRGAEPTPELFDSIQVNAYGSAVPLNTLAQVVITSPSLATISCYDPSTAPNVSEAIRDSGMNFNSRIDDPSSGEVLVPIPKVSAETRMALVKQLHKMTERYRLRIRNVRKRANDKVKKGKDGKLEGVSKDDAFNVGKQIDELTQQMIKKIEGMLEQKENTIKGE